VPIPTGIDLFHGRRNGSHLPTTQCACADFGDFAKQRNGCGGREKDLLRHSINHLKTEGILRKLQKVI
jgi:hypothetical protein